MKMILNWDVATDSNPENSVNVKFNIEAEGEKSLSSRLDFEIEKLDNYSVLISFYDEDDNELKITVEADCQVFNQDDFKSLVYDLKAAVHYILLHP